MSTRQGSGRISSIDILQAIRTDCNNLPYNKPSIKKFNIEDFPNLVEIINKLTEIFQYFNP